MKITVEDLTLSYEGRVVVDHISYSFGPGQIIGIIGPNGAGKSTMIRGVLNLLPRDKGRVSFSGKKLREVSQKIAYVQQRADIDWDFPILVKDVVLLGTYPKLGLFRRPGKQERELVTDCLDQVGMLPYAHKQIGQLSGGQQQRVFLARALAQKADYFFLDEPFVGVDMASEREIMGLLKKLRDQGKIIFIVHHDVTKIHEYFDQLIIMNKSLIAAGRVEQVYTAEHMSRAYHLDLESFEQKGESN